MNADTNQTLRTALNLLDQAETSVASAKKLIQQLSGGSVADIKIPQDHYSKIAQGGSSKDTDDGKVVEGVFNGESMNGADEKTYPVPANYASKSKLIPGDRLKLTISPTGKFLYKQVGPAARRQVLGILSYEDNKHIVIAEGKQYKVPYASVTYFKAEPGDEVAVVIPAYEESEWAAIESVISQPMKKSVSNDTVSKMRQEIDSTDAFGESIDYTLD